MTEAEFTGRPQERGLRFFATCLIRRSDGFRQMMVGIIGSPGTHLADCSPII